MSLIKKVKNQKKTKDNKSNQKIKTIFAKI